MSKTRMPEKRWVKMLTRPKTLVTDPLALNERLLYSYLVSRVGTRRTYSQRRLSRYLGLNKNSLPKIKVKLLKYELIGVNPEGRWFARQPEGEAVGWFLQHKHETGEWHQEYAYWRYYLPTATNPLPYRHLAVYSLISSFGKFNGVSGLAKMLNITRPTVQAAIKRLVKENLVLRQDNWLIARLPEKEKLAWFQDVGKFAATQSLVLTPGTALEKRMRDYGMSSGEISVARKTLAEMVAITMYDQDKVRGLLEKAKAKHDPARYAGNSPGALFIRFLKDYKADLAKSVEVERCTDMGRQMEATVRGAESYEQRLSAMCESISLEDHARARILAPQKRLPQWIAEHGQDKVWNTLRTLSADISKRISSDEFDDLLTGKGRTEIEGSL